MFHHFYHARINDSIFRMVTRKNRNLMGYSFLKNYVRYAFCKFKLDIKNMQMNATVFLTKEFKNKSRSIFTVRKCIREYSRSFVCLNCLIHAFKSLVFFPLTITIFEKVNEQNKLQILKFNI